MHMSGNQSYLTSQQQSKYLFTTKKTSDLIILGPSVQWINHSCGFSAQGTSKTNGASVVRYWEKINHSITTPHCISVCIVSDDLMFTAWFCLFNSKTLMDTKGHYRSVTLEVMASYLTKPSHYLNKVDLSLIRYCSIYLRVINPNMIS